MDALQTAIPADSVDSHPYREGFSPADLVGVPWKRHGMDPSDGLGCWGVVWYVARYYGYEFPRFEQHINGICQELEVAKHKFNDLFSVVSTPKPGDVIMFSIRCDGISDHIGIAISTTHFLHSTPHGGVCLSRLTSPVYQRRVIGIYRWKKEQQST